MTTLTERLQLEIVLIHVLKLPSFRKAFCIFLVAARGTSNFKLNGSLVEP